MRLPIGKLIHRARNLRGLEQISLVTCSDRFRLFGKPGMHNLVGGKTSFSERATAKLLV